MRSKVERHSEEAEKAAGERRRYSAEEKVRIVICGLRGENGIAELCRKQASSRTSTVAGRRTF
jgi:transposase